jgi:hypothetical protein
METAGSLRRRSTTPSLSETDRRPEENMEDRAERRRAPMMFRRGTVKLIGQIVQVRGFAEGASATAASSCCRVKGTLRPSHSSGKS